MYQVIKQHYDKDGIVEKVVDCEFPSGQEARSYLRTDEKVQANKLNGYWYTVIKI